MLYVVVPDYGPMSGQARCRLCDYDICLCYMLCCVCVGVSSMSWQARCPMRSDVGVSPMTDRSLMPGFILMQLGVVLEL